MLQTVRPARRVLGLDRVVVHGVLKALTTAVQVQFARQTAEGQQREVDMLEAVSKLIVHPKIDERVYAAV